MADHENTRDRDKPSSATLVSSPNFSFIVTLLVTLPTPTLAAALLGGR